MNTKTRMIVIVGLAIVVIAGGIGAWLWLAPSFLSSAVPAETHPSSGVNPRFKTDVLQTSSYNRLDKTMIQSGAIPVLPPVPVGKPNPFL